MSLGYFVGVVVVGFWFGDVVL